MQALVVRIGLAVVLALAVSSAAAGAGRSVEVYRPKHRVAEEMLPIARAAMAGGGSASLDRGTNALVLIGEPDAVAEALALLAAQDRRTRTIVLRYGTRRARELDAQGFDVRWTAVAGDFRVGNVSRSEHPDSSVTVRADEALATLADSLTGTLRVAEGARARIETGTSVPYAAQAPGGGTTAELATAATGFDARGRVLGDRRVQVDLAAFAGRIGRAGSIETTDASTLVALTPGETVAVARLGRSNNASRGEAFRGARSAAARDDTLLLLRADLE